MVCMLTVQRGWCPMDREGAGNVLPWIRLSSSSRLGARPIRLPERRAQNTRTSQPPTSSSTPARLDDDSPLFLLPPPAPPDHRVLARLHIHYNPPLLALFLTDGPAPAPCRRVSSRSSARLSVPVAQGLPSLRHAARRRQEQHLRRGLRWLCRLQPVRPAFCAPRCARAPCLRFKLCSRRLVLRARSCLGILTMPESPRW